jgi:predicted AAA+ superfamily ATPase
VAIIHRNVSSKVNQLLTHYPILAITGPRQSGKTTLLKNILPGYRYVSLENSDHRNFASEDPVGFLNKYSSNVILDEVQRVPELFSYLQTRVDDSGQMGQYILSGSQNFHLMESITQSLSGRLAIFKLLPFDLIELKAAGVPMADIRTLIVKGFYPAIYDRNLDHSIYYSNYLQTYVDRDITDLVNVHDKTRFRNFIALCANRTGQLLNLSSLASECGISQPTAKSWMSILENSYIVFLLPPYFENFNKRITRSPKLYFFDTGLASFLLGLRNCNDLEGIPFAGNLFENLIVAEFMKRNYHFYQLRDYYFWRDSNRHEVDLLYKTPSGFYLFEIKSSQTISSKYVKAMEYFAEISGKQIASKTLIYGGDENQERTDFKVSSWLDIQ